MVSESKLKELAKRLGPELARKLLEAGGELTPRTKQILSGFKDKDILTGFKTADNKAFFGGSVWSPKTGWQGQPTTEDDMNETDDPDLAQGADETNDEYYGRLRAEIAWLKREIAEYDQPTGRQGQPTSEDESHDEQPEPDEADELYGRLKEIDATNDAASLIFAFDNPVGLKAKKKRRKKAPGELSAKDAALHAPVDDRAPVKRRRRTKEARSDYWVDLIFGGPGEFGTDAKSSGDSDLFATIFPGLFD